MREVFSYLDYDSAMQYVANSEDIYKVILETYISDQRVDQIKAAFEAQDWDNYRILVHGVKSTSKTIGANELSEHARIMEFAVKEDNIDIILKGNEEFVKEYSDMINRITEDLKQFE